MLQKTRFAHIRIKEVYVREFFQRQKNNLIFLTIFHFMSDNPGFKKEGYTEKERWLRIYKDILKGHLDNFPQNFWMKDGRTKTKILMKYYRKKNNLEKQDLLDVPNRKLIRRAKLYTALQQCYDGDSVALLTDSFEDLKPSDFRWNSNRELDWGKIKSLREEYCTLSEIANYFGCTPDVIRARAEENEVDLSTPEERLIQGSVEEIEFFWDQVEKVSNREISLEELTKTVDNNTEWSRSKISNLLTRYGIKKKVGRTGTKIGKISSFKNYDGRLYPSEEFVASKMEKERLKVLSGYGADFIYKENILIEAKKRLSTHNTPKAILQLIYAEDKLGQKYDKRIYAKEMGNLAGEKSSYRGFTQFYDINLYTFNEKTGDFEEVRMAAERYR